MGDILPEGRWAWVGTMLLLLVVPLLATLPPFLEPGLRSVLMNGFSSVCHQIPDRSPTAMGIPLAVCHRCYGVYLGLPLAGFAYLIGRRWDGLLWARAGPILLLAVLPLSIDWILDFFGILPNTAASRATTGALFGLAAGYYLARGLITWLVRYGRNQPERP